jgi:hypothetical protein
MAKESDEFPEAKARFEAVHTPQKPLKANRYPILAPRLSQ